MLRVNNCEQLVVEVANNVYAYWQHLDFTFRKSIDQAKAHASMRNIEQIWAAV